ncbi:MAG: transporter substrate-binding domain-containing protein [Candidatus Nanopelagicales bacterium]
MSLRSPALVGMACMAAIGTIALSGCQNDATPQTAATSTSPISELASKVPAKIRADGVLTVGIDPSYPPMEFLRRGEAVGADLDLMSAVAQRLGLRAQFIEDTYALLVPGVAARRFEAAISALSVDDNDLQNANMVTYYSSGSQLAVRPPAKKKSGPRNLCGRKITVLDGSQQYAQLSAKSANCVEQKKKPIRIRTYQSQAPATQAVINGKAYGTLAESPVIEAAVAASDGALVVNGKPFAVAPYGIAVDNRRPKVARAIRGALKSIIQDGTYQQILEKWDIAEGALDDPEVLTKKDIPEPTPLYTETTTPSPAYSPTS